MKIKSVVIKHRKGLHGRIVAMIVHKADEIQERYKVKIFLKCKDKKKAPATALMAIVNMKIKLGDEVFIGVDGERENEAMEEIIEFLEGDFSLPDEGTLKQVDNIINSNLMAWELIFQNIHNGIIVVNEKDNIVLVNSAAEKLLNLQGVDVIGKGSLEVLGTIGINIFKEIEKNTIAKRIRVGNSLLMMFTSPVEVDGVLKGAVLILQDISRLERAKIELGEVKELKERLQLILETVQDGICMVNGDGIITYVNKSYEKITGEKEEELIGKNIYKISPNGARVKVLTEGKGIIDAISKKRNGETVVANVTPIIVEDEKLGVVSVIKNISAVQKLTQKLSEMTQRADYLEEELIRTKKPEEVFEKYVGRSGKIVDALAIALKAATSDATVLIRGESGTGKELIADGIHYASIRNGGPFVRVNCAAIPSALLESELFGHEKGAFTGAIKRKLGKFELAKGGTIFLDEIGEMEKSMQSKILRVIQEKEFQRVGGEETIKVDVRIITATHRNLEQMVKDSEFREDLYYRLNVIPIYLPPLRERKQDIALLLEYFLMELQSGKKDKIKMITNEAMEAMLAYRWPGNIRELRNIMERIIALTDKNYICLEDLPSYIKSAKWNNGNKLGEKDIEQINNSKINYDKEITCYEEINIKDEIINSDEILPLKEYEKIIIEKALIKYGSYNKAAKVLGVTHKTVSAKAKEYGIEKETIWRKINS
ncbi:sigma 54-interacting transcriptional regulator [Clostridium fallax]|uniref:HTH-type transcriptional regulatory protein TyrR n=1 Tax=Clostridium fallax TaxID=1533 RepID=A0A1M4SHZ7_9CLOT|nr:sigma 54-interacting transcriptional regulator [Clostridium fallax]SHE31778.1 phosphotransferase system HPr (HPr) family [Clostridium fallax]SQB07838.1 sigma-54 dependent trancsriptional regulator [Clostridium fallax]